MSSRPPSTPPRIPGFIYVALLGQGGFADVFAYDDNLGRRVAVKVLLRNHDGEGEASFGAEASLMAKISHHPSIVSVHRDGLADDGRPFLVMEYCPPPHLSLILKNEALSVQRALKYGIQLAGAVETAHRRQILHRDIKPANILFNDFQSPALTDFGISVSTDLDGTGIGSGVSVAWAPPEQLKRGGIARSSSDVYSLAATIHHMLAGHSPFHVPGGANQQYDLAQRVRNTARPATGRPDVPSSLERVLSTAMSRSPEARYASALEFARALQAVQVELHHAQTEIVVGGTADAAMVDDDGHDGGTELDPFVVIDMDGPGHTSTQSATGTAGRTGGYPAADDVISPNVVQHGRGTADPIEPLEWTGFTDPGVDVAPRERRVAPADPTRTPPSPRRWPKRGALVGGGVAVVGIGAVAAVLLVGGAGTSKDRGASTSPSADHSAADPVGNLVPAPTRGTGVASGSKVVFRWTNPAPQDGDTFLWRVDDPVQDAEFSTATTPTATVAAQPGRTCLDVLLVRAGGRSSDQAVFCYPAETPSGAGS